MVLRCQSDYCDHLQGYNANFFLPLPKNYDSSVVCIHVFHPLMNLHYVLLRPENKLLSTCFQMVEPWLLNHLFQTTSCQKLIESNWGHRLCLGSTVTSLYSGCKVIVVPEKQVTADLCSVLLILFSFKVQFQAMVEQLCVLFI